MLAAHATQCRNGAGSRYPVDVDAGVALELLDRRPRQRTEHAILGTGVEAELIQPMLQVTDVIAAHHAA
jgi:hypothetical protein